MSQFLGISLCNPANIRCGSNWKGSLTPCHGFARFSSFEYGVRALIVLLRTYHYKYKLTSISKVLHRYAPLSENNTYAYIANVTKWMNLDYRSHGVNANINDDTCFCWFRNRSTPSFSCRCLMKAICRQETNFELTDEMIDKALNLL